MRGGFLGVPAGIFCAVRRGVADGLAGTFRGGSGVWEQLCAALSTVVQPALRCWTRSGRGFGRAWSRRGPPTASRLLDGLAQVADVVGIVSALWSEVLQPVLVQLFDLLGALWTAHLQPLWNELTACLAR